VSKTLDLKYNKIEVNDESKETKCTQIILCEIFNPNRRKKTLLEFLKHILNLFFNWKESQTSIWLW